MVGFRNIAALNQRQAIDGAEHFTAFRKVPNVVTGSSHWIDLSMMPGNPSPNYYASTPLKAARLAQSTDGGIRHGGNVSPSTKHVRELLLFSATAGASNTLCLLCDYLLYYPFCSEDGVGEVQTMDNAITLSRYTSGEGVRIMPVVQNPHALAGAEFQVGYTNSRGVAGHITSPARIGVANVAGGLLSADSNGVGRFAPFLPLQTGDTGVRSIEDVTINTIGDVGTFALVLVKPLMTIALKGVDAAVEVDAFMHQGGTAPVIQDDAYLNLVARCAGSLSAAQLLGTLTTTWSD